MASVATRLSTTMAIAIDQVNFSRKFVVSRTPITWFDAPKLAAMPLLGFCTNTARIDQNARNENQGNANRV